MINTFSYKEIENYMLSNIKNQNNIKSIKIDKTSVSLEQSIIHEMVAVLTDNYIFIPSLKKPVVSSPKKTYDLINQSNFIDGYVSSEIKIENVELFVLTHISRIVNESFSKNVIIYNIDNFNENDLMETFSNEFPELFVQKTNCFNLLNLDVKG